jgi:hypothetical protein
VFGDECGTHTSMMTRLYARAPIGERAYASVPRSRGKKNTTLIASMTSSGMDEVMTVEGLTTKAVFEAYVEEFLAPSRSLSGTGGDLGQPRRPQR